MIRNCCQSEYMLKSNTSPTSPRTARLTFNSEKDESSRSSVGSVKDTIVPVSRSTTTTVLDQDHQLRV